MAIQKIIEKEQVPVLSVDLSHMRKYIYDVLINTPFVHIDINICDVHAYAHESIFPFATS
jgi:hypothetical protein